MNDRPTLHVVTRGEREIVMTRDFDATPALVFEAYTVPKLVRQWLLGPDGWTMTTCEIDLRVGGAYRYAWTHAEGHIMGMGGTYRVVERPDRIVCTERFDEPWYEGEALNTTLFEAVGTRTRVTMILQYASTKDRDGVFGSGMTVGVERSLQRLEAMLAQGLPRA